MELTTNQWLNGKVHPTCFGDHKHWPKQNAAEIHSSVAQVKEKSHPRPRMYFVAPSGYWVKEIPNGRANG